LVAGGLGGKSTPTRPQADCNAASNSDGVPPLVVFVVDVIGSRPVVGGDSVPVATASAGRRFWVPYGSYSIIESEKHG
jgi:hypothetical protein